MVCIISTLFPLAIIQSLGNTIFQREAGNYDVAISIGRRGNQFGDQLVMPGIQLCLVMLGNAKHSTNVSCLFLSSIATHMSYRTPTAPFLKKSSSSVFHIQPIDSAGKLLSHQTGNPRIHSENA